jgi:hypothetical protein
MKRMKTHRPWIQTAYYENTTTMPRSWQVSWNDTSLFQSQEFIEALLCVSCLHSILLAITTPSHTAAWWLRRYTTSRKVAGSIPYEDWGLRQSTETEIRTRHPNPHPPDKNQSVTVQSANSVKRLGIRGSSLPLPIRLMVWRLLNSAWGRFYLLESVGNPTKRLSSLLSPSGSSNSRTAGRIFTKFDIGKLSRLFELI